MIAAVLASFLLFIGFATLFLVAGYKLLKELIDWAFE